MTKDPLLLPAPAREPGVIFDQHYTDSLLRVALGPRAYRSRVHLSRSVARKDVLLSLLLFETAHVVDPFWLADDARPFVEPLFSEGLIKAIPNDAYLHAFASLGNIVEKTWRLDHLGSMPPTDHYDTLTDTITRNTTQDYKRYEDATNLGADLRTLLKPYNYIGPMIRAASRHLGENALATEKAIELIHPLDHGLHQLTIEYNPEYDMDPVDGLYSFLRHSVDVLSSEDEQELIDVVLGDESPHAPIARLDHSAEIAIASNARRLRVALLAALTATACERQAAASGLPVRSRATTRGGQVDRTAGDEAYQLFKIQFGELRYPVLENMDDVRRLRSSPHLRSYRTVISEYSTRLRSELASERVEVLKDFQRDIRLAHADLKKLGQRMHTFDSVSFWASFPLMVISTLLTLPIDNLILMPATISARLYSRKRLKELDWLLLGQS